MVLRAQKEISRPFYRAIATKAVPIPRVRIVLLHHQQSVSTQCSRGDCSLRHVGCKSFTVSLSSRTAAVETTALEKADLCHISTSVRHSLSCNREDMEIPLNIVDAFAGMPFEGNQAAICWVGSRNLSEKVMQAIAAEMNLSETAFLTSSTNDYTDQQRFGLRWFTPTNEVPLCGHATLASAATLFQIAGNKNSSITFSTLSGDLYARQINENIVLDFPSNKPEALTAEEVDLAALYRAVFKNEGENVQAVMLASRVKKLLIRMKTGFSRHDLEKVTPDFEAMMACHDGSIVKGVIVTTEGENDYDFLSRYFAPWNGINEDPVTGSAHTVLAPYWSDITHKQTMFARQCSKRGGDVTVTVRSDNRIDIAGKAQLILKGSLLLPA